MKALFARLFARDARPQNTHCEIASPPLAPEPNIPLRKLDDFFQVIEVSNGEFFAGPLFKRRFNCDVFPDTPKHFVALYQQENGSFLTLGYVHFEIWEQNAMGGGMVMDERAWRLLPAPERKLIRAQGGVAELLLKNSIALLPQDLYAIWGYVGDPLALKVDLRVGFQQTRHEHVVVIWRNIDDDSEKDAWLQRVIDYGPF